MPEPPRAAPWLLLITGPPGVGKTTLARQLAAALGLPLIERDAIKEQLFDTLGWSDRAWSRRLGQASYGLLAWSAQLLLGAGQSLIVESNFQPGRSETDLRQLQAATGCRLLVVQCRAEPAVLLARVRQRWASGQRHPGHVDDVAIDELASRLPTADAPLDLDAEHLVIDTTDPTTIDLPALLDQLRARLALG